MRARRRKKHGPARELAFYVTLFPPLADPIRVCADVDGDAVADDDGLAVADSLVAVARAHERACQQVTASSLPESAEWISLITKKMERERLDDLFSFDD